MASQNGLLALGAAAAWGGGDFSGGMGVRKIGGSTAAAVRFLLLAHSISLVVLVLLLLPHGIHLSFTAPLLWGLGSGVAAALSLTAFYMALARGEMGASAAISGVLAAAIPALVSTFIEGAPTPLRIAGFLIAGIAIWAIAAGEGGAAIGSTFWLATAGGVGFGIYFVALRMANPLGVVLPMALARVASVTTCGLLMLILMAFSSREEGAKASQIFSVWPWALGVALMDTGGNLLFVAATRLGRLDVAAVLASLYPASTILLAAWRLHEKPSRRQLAGMVLALFAVVLITI
jgi:drug/metabolite transporter (DMT)-like permease